MIMALSMSFPNASTEEYTFLNLVWSMNAYCYDMENKNLYCCFATENGAACGPFVKQTEIPVLVSYLKGNKDVILK